MNEKEILVEVKDVSKKFSRNLKRSLIYGLQDVIKNIFNINSGKSDLRKTEFWAVKDTSFQLHKGECIGLIGHNGAGKSTLLKMLNGLIKPDEGEIIMRGRVGALIELGAGFNPVLTGRENVFVNGQLLGFSKHEIEKKFQAILDFSEIGEFIDSPVQNYSSGMKVRLGFAVAAQMEPDILIIDEVLAVGDVGFQGKCLKAIHEMLNKSAVIFVSHSMPLVNRYCNRVILMNGGKVEIDSFNVQEPIDKYLESFEKNELGNKFNSGQLILNSFSCNGHDLNIELGKIDLHANAKFLINLTRKDSSIKSARVRLNLINKDLLIIASIISDKVMFENDLIEIKIESGPFNIQPNTYKLSLIVFGDEFNNPMIINNSLYSLKVNGEKDYGGNIVLFNSQTT